MARTATPAQDVVMTSISNPVTHSNHIKVTLDGSSVQPEGGQSLYECLKHVLLFCKLIGLVPFASCPKSSFEQSNFKWLGRRLLSSLLGLIALLMLAAYAAVAFYSVLQDKFTNVAEYSRKPGKIIFYFTALFLYFYHHRHYSRMLRMFESWDGLKLNFAQKDRTLWRDANLIAGIILASTVIENGLGHLRFKNNPVTSQDHIDSFGYDPKNESFLRIYYRMGAAAWEPLVPFNETIAVYAYICEKFAWYGLNVSAVIVIILSRAVSFQFKNLCLQGELVTCANTDEPSQDATLWKNIAHDHHTLWLGLSEIREFLSPLVFVNIGLSTYFICLQIRFGLSSTNNVTALDHVFAVWSIGHIWLRLVSICYAGSRVNEWAGRVGDLLRKCPSEAISLDVVRVERYITWNEIGLTGLGCYTVTNNLLLRILGVVMTFEVIILQAANQGQGRSNCPTQLQ